METLTPEHTNGNPPPSCLSEGDSSSLSSAPDYDTNDDLPPTDKQNVAQHKRLQAR